jgi:hypothetical protein
MASIFFDRKPTQPNRYRVVPESGEPYYIVLERADEPTSPGTPLNAENLNSLVSVHGDTLDGALRFENDDEYHVFRKFRTVNGSDYGMNVGLGMLGGRGVVAFEVRSGTEDNDLRLGRVEIGELGVTFVDVNGVRTYLHRTAVEAKVE